MVEITLRTVGGRYLFKPTDAVRIGVLTAIARALLSAPVRLHAFVYLSNHAHLLLSVLHAERMSAFLRSLNAMTARVAQVATGWQGQVWVRPKHAVILDDGAAQKRLDYVMSNSVKEGLVWDPRAWPGASAAAALVTGAPIVVEHERRSRRGNPLGRVEHRFELTPLPAWASLPQSARAERVLDLFAEISARAAVEREGRPALGIDKLLAADPFEVHELEDDGPAPLAYASEPELLERYLADYALFQDSFRSAASGYRRTAPVGFPPNSFPPSPAFVTD